MLGNKTQIDVTILENDNPYGLVSFLNTPENLYQRGSKNLIIISFTVSILDQVFTVAGSQFGS